MDSTFAPPPLQYPFKWGADMVMHSGAYGGLRHMPACLIMIYRHQVLWRALGSAVRRAHRANRGRVADGKCGSNFVLPDRSGQAGPSVRGGSSASRTGLMSASTRELVLAAIHMRRR